MGKAYLASKMADDVPGVARKVNEWFVATTMAEVWRRK
jgi:hypothetical protein